jgi:hypothetical protein
MDLPSGLVNKRQIVFSVVAQAGMEATVMKRIGIISTAVFCTLGIATLAHALSAKGIQEECLSNPFSATAWEGILDRMMYSPRPFVSIAPKRSDRVDGWPGVGEEFYPRSLPQAL